MLESYYEGIYQFYQNIGVNVDTFEFQLLAEVIGSLPFIFIGFIVFALLRKIIDFIVGGL